MEVKVLPIFKNIFLTSGAWNT